MQWMTPNIIVVTLNVNELFLLIKSLRLSDGIKKYMLLIKDTF